MDKLLEYYSGDLFTSGVWKDKYALKNNKQQIVEETPTDMHWRLAKELARSDINAPRKETIDISNLSDFGRKLYDLLQTLSVEQLEQWVFSYLDRFKYVIPQGSIMSALGNTYKLQSLSNCFQGNTKVLTRQGFKKISELSGKTVSIMTNGGGWVEASFRDFGVQKLMKLELHRGKTSSKTILCTDNHRWFISKGDGERSKIEEVPTKDLLPGQRLKSQFGKSRSSFGLSPFGIAHGITFGDGGSNKNQNFASGIALCGDSRALGKYFINEKVSSDENLCEGGSDLYTSLPNFFKQLPDINENKAYLYGWLAGYFAADGNIDERGSLAIHSVNKENIEFVQDVCGVLGIGCGEVQSQTIISNLTNKEQTMYKVFLYSQFLTEDFFLLEKHRVRFQQREKTKMPAKWEVVSVSETDLEEIVYCAEVPDTHSFVIEGNILTGNCFVIPSPYDSYGGIFKTDQEVAQLEKRRGGVGTNLNTLRPEDTLVLNAAGTSTGAHSFMDRYSNTTREVAQNGRRGALMLLMMCLHPDIFKFVSKKKDTTKVTGANISVQLTNAFMEAVENNSDFYCRFPINAELPSSLEWAELDTVAPYNKLVEIENVLVMRIKAKELFDLIVEMAWDNAEPGVAFMDTVINYSPEGAYEQFKPIASNPCGEQWMEAYDACRLLAVNLFSMVVNPFRKDAYIDYDKLYEVFYIQQRLADNIVDLEIEYVGRIIDKIKSDPEPNNVKAAELELWTNIQKTAVASRRTGCGFTALADLLAAIGLKYDSDEAIATIEKVMKKKIEAELDATIDLAITRGTFDGWDRTKELQNAFYEMIQTEFPVQAKRMWNYGRRNVSWSTVAPTGSVSIIAILTKYSNTSSGVEPVFLPFYFRNRKVNPSNKDVRVDFHDQNGDAWQTYPIMMGGFKEWIETVVSEEEVNKGIENLPKERVEELFKQSPYYGACANDISWEKRIKIQSVVQRYTTNAISSTLNLPKDVSKETVANIYKLAWKSGLKGVTIYRDGCRTGVLVSEESKKESFQYRDSAKRPKKLEGELHIATAQGKKYAVIVGLFNNNPYELFAFEATPEIVKVGKLKGEIVKIKKGHYNFVNGSEDHTITDLQVIAEKGQEQMLTRLVSGMLRHGAKPQFVMEQIDKCELDIVSFGNAIKRILKKYVKEEEFINRNTCKNCGSTNLRVQEGCLTCIDCGDSKC